MTWSRIPSSTASNVKIKVLDVPGHNLSECTLTRRAIGQGFPVCLFVILHIELQRIPEKTEDCQGLESDEPGGQTGFVVSAAAVLKRHHRDTGKADFLLLARIVALVLRSFVYSHYYTFLST